MAAADTAAASAPASRRPQPATARPVKASGSAAIRAVRAVVPRGMSPRGVSTCVLPIVAAFFGRYLLHSCRADMLTEGWPLRRARGTARPGGGVREATTSRVPDAAPDVDDVLGTRRNTPVTDCSSCSPSRYATVTVAVTRRVGDAAD